MRSLVLVLLAAGVWTLIAATPAAAADVDGTGVGTSTMIVVIGVTILALMAAVVAGRRAGSAVDPGGTPIRGDLLDIDLFASRPASDAEPRIVRVFEIAFLLILILYAALDRGFAWLHVPGTPLFVGEMTLGLGVLAMMASRVPMATTIRRSPALKALVAWMAWGLIFLVAQLPEYGIDAIRDSALWYYGVVAIFTVFLMLSDPSRFGRWADLFGKALPFLLIWFPIAVVLATLFGEGAPYVPDSDVPMFVHRFGNIAVLGAIAIGYIWLVDRERGRLSANQRIVYTVLASIGVLLVAFQNRGGMVSAAIGLIVMLLFLRRRRGELVLVLAGVVVFASALAIVTDVSIPISSGREVSAAQMMDNIASIINPGSGDDRQTETTQWRLDLWSTVIDDVSNERPLTGFGPGPNLGAKYGVSTNEDVPLRNPHNSHVGILARMGWVGVGMWAVLWLVWVFELLQLRTRLLGRGRSVEAGLVAWLVTAQVMFLVNAIFDPTLEGPQVSFWFWALFGIGAAMPLVYSGIIEPVRNAGVAATGNAQNGGATSVAGGPPIS